MGQGPPHRHISRNGNWSGFEAEFDGLSARSCVQRSQPSTARLSSTTSARRRPSQRDVEDISLSAHIANLHAVVTGIDARPRHMGNGFSATAVIFIRHATSEMHLPIGSHESRAREPRTCRAGAARILTPVFGDPFSTFGYSSCSSWIWAGRMVRASTRRSARARSQKRCSRGSGKSAGDGTARPTWD